MKKTDNINSNTASKNTRNIKLTKQQARNERIYQTTMYLARKLLYNQTITVDEYKSFEAKMKEKYKPVIGGLFSDSDLILQNLYGNMSHNELKGDKTYD